MSLSNDQEETLTLFLAGAEGLQALPASLRGDQLDCAAEPGGWSVRQIVHYLQTIEVIRATYGSEQGPG